MGRKPKLSKEVKAKVFREYEESNVNFNDIAKGIRAHHEVLWRWYLRYKEHGLSTFETSNKNRSYSKEFKLSVVEEYTSGKYSLADLSTKHNIGTRVILLGLINGIEIKDYDPKGDIYTMKSGKTTFEERLEIAKWVIDNNMSYKDAAEKHGITYALVYKWTRAYLDKGPEALRYQKRGPKPKSEIDKSKLTEVEKLKLELEKERTLRRWEFDLEILKKRGNWKDVSLSKVRHEAEYKTVDFLKDKGYPVTKKCLIEQYKNILMQSPYFIVIWNSNTLIIPFKAGIFYRKKFETLGELRERIAEYINVYNKDRFLMCKIFLIKLLVYLTRISSLVDACVTFSLGFIAISSNSSMSRYVDLSSSIIVAVYLIKNGIITIKSREDFVFGNKTLH